jgi:hypothetical protein
MFTPESPPHENDIAAKTAIEANLFTYSGIGSYRSEVAATLHRAGIRSDNYWVTCNQMRRIASKRDRRALNPAKVHLGYLPVRATCAVSWACQDAADVERKFL